MSEKFDGFSWRFDESSDKEAATRKSPAVKLKSRPRRVPKQTFKLRETVETLTSERQNKAVVKCSQTGEQHIVKLKDLSKEDNQPILNDDLFEGSSLLVERNHNTYPVEFVKFKDDDSNTSKLSKPQKRIRSTENGQSNASDTLNVLKKAKDASSKTIKQVAATKNPSSQPLTKTTDVPAGNLPSPISDQHEDLSSKKSKTVTENPPSQSGTKDNQRQVLGDNIPKSGFPTTTLDNSDKDLIINLAGKIDKLEQRIKDMMEMMNNGEQSSKAIVKQEEILSFNGKPVNVDRIPAGNEYVYGLRLMDVLFSKEEMARSLLFESKRNCNKPALDKERVNLMLNLIDKRFGKKWDLSKLTAKCNQKCRDARNFFEIIDDSDTSDEPQS